MIDIEVAKNEFRNYVRNYDINDKKVKLKIAHIERTSLRAKQIAESLRLEQDDIELAELIGLLHDIGRFEQIKQYGTFNDKKSVNHGELGVKLLFEDGLIRSFIQNDKYDDIIKNSILNHNKNKKDLKFSNKREELHSKIIRDADKTDILYILTFEEKEVAWEKADLSEEKITEEVYREYIEEKSINYKEIRTAADLLVAHFAYIFDFNYRRGLELIKENRYLEKIYGRFTFNDQETENKYERIYGRVKKYMENI